jgi:hypothetical protein
MRLRPLLLLLLLGLTLSVAAAPPQQIRVTGIYSDLEYIPEAGDLGGREIFVIYGGKAGYFALVQCSEGFPTKPALAAAKINGAQIEFTLSESDSGGCPAKTFIGEISRKELKGQFSGEREPSVLKRKRSYWQ